MRARFVAAVLTLHAALTLVSSDVEAQRRRRRAPSPPPAPPVVRSLPALREQIAHLAVEAGGPVGVTALHVESGERVSLGGGERFPLASLYKVPATIQFLHRVDQGQLRVTDLIQLGASDARTGRSLISARLARERVTYSVQELLRLALVQSDNAAADVILSRWRYS